MLEEASRSGAPHVTHTFYAPREDPAPARPFINLGAFNKVGMVHPSPILYDRREAGVNHRCLGVVGIVSILYVYLCAGPIGSEDVISSSGPFIGILAFLLYALVVAFPFAYIVAELCSAFPEDGGFTVWVLHAFGPFWAFQVGYWSWFAGVLRGALMPGTLLKLLTGYYDIEIKSSALTYLVKAVIGILLAIPTLMGTRTVGRLSFAVLVVVLVSFTLFTFWVLTASTKPHNFFQVRRENLSFNQDTRDVVSTGAIAIQWTTLLNKLFFKFKGINNASVFGGEVQNPARSYVRAIAWTSVLILVTYVFPITAGLLSDALPWFKLDHDSFPFFAYFAGGTTLRTIVQIATCCGSAGMCMAALYIKAFMVSGMAENRLVPTILAKRSQRFQSPFNAVVVTLVAMLALISVDFNDILTMTNAFSAAVQLLIIATVIKLRRELPYIARPTKVPGGVPTLYAIAVVPTFMFGYITFYALYSFVSAVLMVAFFVPGVAYGGYRFHYRRSLV